MGNILDATEAAIRAAKHLTEMDRGAVETLRALALKIDLQDVYYEALQAEYQARGLKPPAQDNVSIPTYLKFCESLGLTPAGRVKANPKGGAPAAEAGGSKLARLRAVHDA